MLFIHELFRATAFLYYFASSCTIFPRIAIISSFLVSRSLPHILRSVGSCDDGDDVRYKFSTLDIQIRVASCGQCK